MRKETSAKPSDRGRRSRPAGGRNREAQNAIVALLSAADSTRRFLGAVVANHGLTLQQYNVLRILRGAAPEPLPCMEIGERMIEKTPGITRFLDALEGRGLVRRARSTEDRRLVHTWLADGGAELLDLLDAEVAEADRATMAGLSRDELATLGRLLAQVRRNTG